MDPLTSTLLQALTASLAMLIIGALMLIIYFLSPGAKSTRRIGDKSEPYLGGEKAPFDVMPIGSVNLFWSIINQSLRSVYRSVIRKLSTYSMHDWLFYMSIWFMFLVALLVILFSVLLW